jgi:hypothetical protein
MAVLLSLKNVKRNSRAKRMSIRRIRQCPTQSLDQPSGPDSTIKLCGPFGEVTVGIKRKRRHISDDEQ